jgi:hypothetical protein
MGSVLMRARGLVGLESTVAAALSAPIASRKWRRLAEEGTCTLPETDRSCGSEVTAVLMMMRWEGSMAAAAAKEG